MDKLLPAFASVFMVSVLVAMFLVLVACSGTRAAYERAETLDAKAYVVTENYAAILHEANDLAGQASTPRELVTALQAADRRASPLVLKLRAQAAVYGAARNAENAAELQAALDAAAVEVAGFLRAIRSR